MRKQILFCVLLCFLITHVLALGVTPARNLLDYQANKQVSGSFKVINDEGTTRTLVIKKSGDLAELIDIRERRIDFTSDVHEKVIDYTLAMPQDLEPGNHKTEIIITELQDEVSDDNTVVGATLLLKTEIEVRVPYPGKYVDAKLFIKNEGEGVIFTIPSINQGQFDIANLHASIDIFNKAGQNIQTLTTESIALQSKAKGDLRYTWKTDEPVGDYHATATLIYDGESKTIESSFKIGDVLLELEQISVNNFQLGEIAKMDLLVTNKWSENINNVYTQVQVYSENNEILSDFKSPDTNIPALQKQVLSSYWDTTGVQVGTYDTKVTLHYADKKKVETDIQLVVKENSLEVIGIGYVLSEDGGGFNFNEDIIMILVIIIILLVLVNVLWFIILRRILKKKGK